MLAVVFKVPKEDCAPASTVALKTKVLSDAPAVNSAIDHVRFSGSASLLESPPLIEAGTYVKPSGTIVFKLILVAGVAALLFATVNVKVTSSPS